MKDKDKLIWFTEFYTKSQFSKDKSEKYDIIIRCKAR